jgi:hypothetical protein
MIMWRIVETQLSNGMGAIVDCPLARRELYDTATALAAKVGEWPDASVLKMRSMTQI